MNSHHFSPYNKTIYKKGKDTLDNLSEHRSDIYKIE